MYFGQSVLLNIEYPTIVNPNATISLPTVSDGTTSALSDYRLNDRFSYRDTTVRG